MQVGMIRENLEDIPRFAVPEPFAIRRFRPGDEAAWVRIHEIADEYNHVTFETFDRAFGEDPAALPERMFFLCDEAGREIGTATAWYDEDYRALPFGRVHYVAIVPAFQGRGLAKPLMSVVCYRLRELGYERARLVTQTERVRAIGLYLKFGFVPDVQSDEERRAWEELRKAHPHLFGG